MSYHQKQDLLRFGQQVQRLLVQRLIAARNAGRLTPEQLAVLEELVPTVAEVQILLDSFEPSIDVASALAELEPMLPRMRAIRDTTPSGWLHRVETAIKCLKADPR